MSNSTKTLLTIDPLSLTEDGLKALSREELTQAFLNLKQKHLTETAEYQSKLLAKNEEIAFLSAKEEEVATGSGLTKEQEADIEIFVKHWGFEALLRNFNETCVRMSQHIFAYENKVANQERERQRAKIEGRKFYANYGVENYLDQQLGQLIAESMFIRKMLADKYPGADKGIYDAKLRWLNHWKYFAEEQETKNHSTDEQ